MSTSLSNPTKARIFYPAMLRGLPTPLLRWGGCLLLTLFTALLTLSVQAQDVIYGLTGRLAPDNQTDYSVYALKTDGSSFTELKTLTKPRRTTPVGSLVEGSDGFLYGVTTDRDLAGDYT